ncbi:MAG: ACT domain-containing protein [Victivallaceae bacterium]|nr:ACT domain-containing protein [Victivallaceae bacterium]
MKIKQLSLFIENRSGTLNQVCQVLKRHNINICTLALADTEQFGITRLLIRDWQLAKEVLEAAGLVVNVTEVLALPVPDRPGGLADLLSVLDENDINIEYIYAFSYNKGRQAIMVFRFENPDKALKVLAQANINVMESIDLFS